MFYSLNLNNSITASQHKRYKFEFHFEFKKIIMNTTALTLLQKYVDSHFALNVLLLLFFFQSWRTIDTSDCGFLL